jgi:hypothetical protein
MIFFNKLYIYIFQEVNDIMSKISIQDYIIVDSFDLFIYHQNKFFKLNLTKIQD